MRKLLNFLAAALLSITLIFYLSGYRCSYLAAEGRIIEKADVNRGNGHEDGSLSNRRLRPRNIERVFDPNTTSSEPREMRGKRQSVDMKQREDVDDDVVGRHLPARFKPLDAGGGINCVWTTPFGHPVVPEL